MMRRLVGRAAPALGIYLAFRTLSAIAISVLAPGKAPAVVSNPAYHVGLASESHTYWDVVTSWDAQWYADIVLHGYPQSPLGSDGQPVQTGLAFYPLYPLLVRALMSATHLSFAVAAPLVSLVAGAAAMIVVFHLVESCTSRRGAITVLVLLNAFPAAPIFQAAYTESLALLLIAVALLLLHSRRYLWFLVPVVLLSLTRNLVLVMAAVVAVHWLVQEISQRSSPERVPRGRLVAVLAATVCATLSWPAVAWALTGRHDAYFQSVKAWPRFTGSVLQPPWVMALVDHGAAGVLVGVVGAALFIALLFRPPVMSWGPELWAWTAMYPAYILLTTSVGTSIVRYMVLAFPLGLLLAPVAGRRGLRSWTTVTAVAAIFLGLQWLWLSHILLYTGPTGGWGFP